MLYAITDRLYGTDEAGASQHLLGQVAVWCLNGVAFIQLREKDLSARDQVKLARAMLQVIDSVEKRTEKWSRFVGDTGSAAASARDSRRTRLLVNGRPDVALAAGADGVHLAAGPQTLTPAEVRTIFSAAGRSYPPTISISCHTLLEVETASRQSPDCILFAPVFEKIIAHAREPASQTAQKLPGTGLSLLEQACQLAAPVPVFALGGVTADNAADCLRVGASGIAAIRLLQQPASTWRQFALR